MFRTVPIFETSPTRPACHCSTLVELPDGTLRAAWFAGSYETAPDVAIMAARWHSDTRRWSEPRAIADTPGKSDGQPVLLAHPNGALWLFYVTIEESDWTSARMKYRISHDGGETWTGDQVLPAASGMMFRSKPLILPSGAIILPVYDEKTWRSFSMISLDAGNTWRLGEPIVTPPGNIHPCIVPLASGQLLAYLRTGGSGGWIWRAVSSDGGWTWREVEPTSIPNPNSGIDLIRLRSGALVLAFNNSATERTPLDVALSEDEGATWVFLRTIAQRLVDSTPRATHWQSYWGGPNHPSADRRPEYSYPTLLQTRDGLIHLVYTDNRVRIQHVVFDEAWLRSGQQ